MMEDIEVVGAPRPLGAFMVISACRGTPDDERRTGMLEAFLRSQGLESERVTGVWEGKEETSFLVPWSAKAHTTVRKLGESFEQDAVLYSSATGQGYLLLTSGNKGAVGIGTIRVAGFKPPRDCTYVPSRDVYFWYE